MRLWNLKRESCKSTRTGRTDEKALSAERAGLGVRGDRDGGVGGDR